MGVKLSWIQESSVSSDFRPRHPKTSTDSSSKYLQLPYRHATWRNFGSRKKNFTKLKPAKIAKNFLISTGFFQNFPKGLWTIVLCSIRVDSWMNPGNNSCNMHIKFIYHWYRIYVINSYIYIIHYTYCYIISYPKIVTLCEKNLNLQGFLDIPGFQLPHHFFFVDPSDPRGQRPLKTIDVSSIRGQGKQNTDLSRYCHGGFSDFFLHVLKLGETANSLKTFKVFAIKTKHMDLSCWGIMLHGI